jgi:hypothetical protein
MKARRKLGEDQWLFNDLPLGFACSSNFYGRAVYTFALRFIRKQFSNRIGASSSEIVARGKD